MLQKTSTRATQSGIHNQASGGSRLSSNATARLKAMNQALTGRRIREEENVFGIDSLLR